MHLGGKPGRSLLESSLICSSYAHIVIISSYCHCVIYSQCTLLASLAGHSSLYGHHRDCSLSHIVREEEFYLYTLHDPTVSSKGIASSTIPFANLCPIVDRHTRFVNRCYSLFSNATRQVQDIPLDPVLHWARVWRPKHCPLDRPVQGRQGGRQP